MPLTPYDHVKLLSVGPGFGGDNSVLIHIANDNPETTDGTTSFTVAFAPTGPHGAWRVTSIGDDFP